MQVKISIISIFAIMMISGTVAPSMVSGQFTDSGLVPDYDPGSDCIFPDDKLTYTLNQDSYVLNDELVISGQVIPELNANKYNLKAQKVYLSIVKVKSIFITPFTNGTTQDIWYNLPEEEVNASMNAQNSKLSTLDTTANIDECGYFENSIKLHPIVIKNGYYDLEISYMDTKLQTQIFVFDDDLQKGCYATSWSAMSPSRTGTEQCPEEFPLPELILELDKEKYFPGEKVKISGQIKNAVFFDDVEITLQSQTSTEESPAVSKTIVLFGVEPTFNWLYYIDDGASGIGTYSVSADTHLGTVTSVFTVDDESILTDYAAQQSTDETSSTPKKIIDKYNRITVSEIPISLGEKTSEEQVLVPRVIQGSLFTAARGDESSINIQVSSSSGHCVIGQNADCSVNDSTRKPGSIYQLVQIDGENYKVRYNGADVRLEKFTILPEKSNTEINTKDWHVSILKDDQPTRFYYKVSYVFLE